MRASRNLPLPTLAALLCSIGFALAPCIAAAQVPADGATPAQPSASAAERMGAALASAPVWADYAALFRGRRFSQIERMANARLAVEPNDAWALIAKSSAIVGAQNIGRIEEAVKLAERAVAQHPQNANAHEALGNALGTKAVSSGVASALGYATKIRDSYQRAIELNPSNFSARFSLLQYYSAAPSFLGGGKGRVNELLSQTQALNPAAAQLMRAAIALSDKQAAQAEQLASTANVAGSDDLSMQQRLVLASVGSQLVNEQKFADAERVFKDLARRFPQNEVGLYGQARALSAQGQHAQALALYDQAQAIYASAAVYYRKGQSLQALGDADKAASAYRAALNAVPGLSKNQLADAKEQLAALKK